MYAALVLGAAVAFAAAPEGTNCVWDQPVAQTFSFAAHVPGRPALRSAKERSASIMVVSPGLEADVRTYHFWREGPGDETSEIAIEGPFTADEINRRFGTRLTPYRNATLWVMPEPVLDKPGELTVSVRHRESGHDRTTGEPCLREMRRRLFTMTRTPPKT
jgi:hypothetical protein